MMPIYRAKRKSGFSMTPNDMLADANLTFKARGILSYMLSMKDDWVFYQSELAKHTKEGPKSIKAGIDELIEAGYIYRERVQGGWKWFVYDDPKINPHNTFLADVKNGRCHKRHMTKRTDAK